MITHHRRRTKAARTQRQLRQLIREASTATATHPNDMLAVDAQANWWR